MNSQYKTSKNSGIQRSGQNEIIEFTGARRALALIHLFVVILAITLAVSCNRRGERFGPVLAAIFVPEIYLMQRGIRQFIIKEPGYGCFGAGSGSILN